MHPPRFTIADLVLLAVAGVTPASAAETPAALSYRVHFIGHTGIDRPAQTMATGLAVAADGTCFVSSNGPGDHPAPCWYNGGKLAGRCAVPDIPGLQFTGALAVSDAYIIAAARVLGSPGVPPSSAVPPSDNATPRPGADGLWRFHRDGSHAPAHPGPHPAFLPIRLETTSHFEGPHLEDPHADAPGPETPRFDTSRPMAKAPAISGLWIHAHEVFVSDAEAGRIRVYDEATLEESRYFKADQPGGLCVLGSQLHVIERGAVVSTFTLDGRRTGQVLDEGEDLSPAALAPTPEGRLMVADAGPSQQVHFFNMSGVPTRVRTLGEPGGMLAPPAPGEAGPRRLDSVIGIGADTSGGLSVAMNPPPGGCILRAFERDRVSLRWQSTTLAILSGADATLTSQGSDLHSAAGRHALDLSKPPGQSWRWVSQFKQPAHPPDGILQVPQPTAARPPLLSSPAPAHPDSTTTVCEIDTHRFLAIRSANGYRLDLHRAVGQTIVPVATWQSIPANPRNLPPRESNAEASRPEAPWQWLDSNGNGLTDPSETSPTPQRRGRFPTTPIDAAGGLWMIDAATIHHWPCQGVDPSGLPRHTPEPISFQPVFTSSDSPESLCYDPPSSSLYVTTRSPTAKGSTLLRFSTGLPQTRAAPPLWNIPLAHTSSVAAAGRFVFTLNPGSGEITVHHHSNGSPLGQLRPPLPVPKANFQASLRAQHLPDDSYLVITQDPAAPRALAFHLLPPFPPAPKQ